MFPPAATPQPEPCSLRPPLRSLKLNPDTVQFFFKADGGPDGSGSFPLYTEAIQFCNHRESMVRKEGGKTEGNGRGRREKGGWREKASWLVPMSAAAAQETTFAGRQLSFCSPTPEKAFAG